MKVLRDGRQDNKPVQIQCTRCRSLLEVERSDLINVSSDYRDGTTYQFRCGVCQQGIYLNSSKFNWVL